MPHTIVRRSTPTQRASNCPRQPSSGLLVLGGVPTDYAANTEIFGQGELVTGLYQMISGCVCTYHLLADGRRQIIAFYLPGSVFGFEQAATHFLSAEAIVASRITGLEPVDVAILADDCRRKDLWKVAMNSLMQAQEHALLLGRKCALERVSAFLLEMMERQGTRVVSLPMTRIDIADYLGLTVETVSRMFAELTERGLIELQTPRLIALLDIEGLAEAGELPLSKRADDRRGNTALHSSTAVRINLQSL